MLKYVVLANMLALSSINPFDSREAKVYQDDPEITAMASLRTAYENNDIQTIDQLLTNPSYRRGYSPTPSSRRTCRTPPRPTPPQVLQNIIKPYRCVSLAFLAKEINVAADEVVSLLVQLILDEKARAASRHVRPGPCGGLAPGGDRSPQRRGDDGGGAVGARRPSSRWSSFEVTFLLLHSCVAGSDLLIFIVVVRSFFFRPPPFSPGNRRKLLE
ncbi:unnamed protein product [Prorocentrum cordatum]|uniref:PCI domain-containing protein n=1 Tax=Prorocentrum cordatum TaxID=2364126 RepID=A0ABN9RDR9_9DINO|nr:unnamed protein product [Polarella glacialis]